VKWDKEPLNPVSTLFEDRDRDRLTTRLHRQRHRWQLEWCLAVTGYRISFGVSQARLPVIGQFAYPVYRSLPAVAYLRTGPFAGTAADDWHAGSAAPC